MAAIGEMAAGIAHEIYNPLTGVIGYSELLLEENLSPDIKEQVKIIADSGNRVKGIVKRMLMFAHQTKPMKTSSSINELIDATLDLRSYVLRTANIEVVKHLDPDLPWLVVDPGQMQQVFLNLTSLSQKCLNCLFTCLFTFARV
jgi:nitrogen-specific signal transduction histidine kinase